jgi:hypothetical protein
MNRLNAESCPYSARLSKLTMVAEAWWNRMHLAADDWGIFQTNPKILKGKLWPLRDDMTIEIIEILLNEYTETKLVHQFLHKGETYGYFLGWFEHQKIRYMSARKYPAPPKDEISFEINHKTKRSGEKEERFGSDCIEVSVHCANNERTESAHRLPVTVTVTVIETVTGGKECGDEKPVPDPTPKPPKKPKKGKGEVKVKSTAINAYRDVFHLWPNSTQEEAINNAISQEKEPMHETVTRWSQICETWALRGFKPTNVQGMLDWLRNGIPPAGPKGKTGDKVTKTLNTLANRIEQHRREAEVNGG